KRLYRARTTPQLVEVPELSFLMIDGRGDPNSAPEYRDAVQALYTLSYTLKFALKREQGLDYHVGPLQGLWWAEDMSALGSQRKADWKWTMMIAQTDAVTEPEVESARAEASRKKQLPGLTDMRLERFCEGLSAQILHVGPYNAEAPAIETLHAFVHANGLTFDGRWQKHHEIYLGDPRRTAPERLKTIIRQPVSQAT